MKNCFRILIACLVLFPLSTFASVEGCKKSYLTNYSHNELENFLDCLTQEPVLSKLAAQWLVLRKAKWTLSKTSTKLKLGKYKYSFSSNPYSPNQKNQLQIGTKGLKETDLKDFLILLEGTVFPKALNGFISDDDQARNKTSWAFEGTSYHYIALADTAFNKQNTNRRLNFWKKKESGIQKIFYPGTLMASERFPTSWYQTALDSNLFPILKLDPVKDLYWHELRSYYRQRFTKCETSCLERQEARILQGIMMTFSHPQLMRAVHETRLNFEYYPTQNSLPNIFGCEDQFITGSLKYNYSLTGNGYSHSGEALNLAQFGTHGLLGRALYLRGIDLNRIAHNNNSSVAGYSGQFQGQNAIIRKITPAAVESLKRIGGLGSRKLKLVSSLDGILPPGMTQDDVIAEVLDNASLQIADYMKKRHLGQNVKNHPVSKEAFYSETVLSRGHTLKKWVDILYKLNPNVQYYIFGYDYGLRAAPRFMNEPDRKNVRIAPQYYYDRIVKVLQTEFKSIGSSF